MKILYFIINDVILGTNSARELSESGFIGLKDEQD